MGNILTFYNGNSPYGQMEIQSDFPVASFTIIDYPLSLSQITVNTKRFSCTEDAGSGAGLYNLTFLANPVPTNQGEVLTYPASKRVFTADAEPSPTAPHDVHWTNVYNNFYNATTNQYDEPFNIDPTNESAGAGSGDPHIIPYINPRREVFLLPVNNSIYKYFDNMDEEHRVVVNVKMWMLNSKFIFFVERLKKQQDPLYRVADGMIPMYRSEDSDNELDTSFARYVCFMYRCKSDPSKNETLVMDLESMKFVEWRGVTDDDVENLELRECGVSSVSGVNGAYNFFKIGAKYMNQRRLHYLGKQKFRKRLGSVGINIDFQTEKIGMMRVKILRELSRPNHRNHLDFEFLRSYKIDSSHMCGTIIDVKQREIVPSLFHINENVNDVYTTNAKIETINEYKAWLKPRMGQMEKELEETWVEYRKVIEKKIKDENIVLDSNISNDEWLKESTSILLP